MIPDQRVIDAAKEAAMAVNQHFVPGRDTPKAAVEASVIAAVEAALKEFKPSAAWLLDKLSEFTDSERSLFFHALDYSMHDEWDCGIESWFATFGNGEELKIAIKTAAGYAAYIEREIGEDNRDT